ncbi:hypothetical protein [Faecalispora jeddahensis]|uniref:hypothetical protein n=1 Tax=Faecalispora jeddahensis TaxID=1414721 RepID=UPI00189A793B|nr:hypothetical protein [Faecalispora jeddahensis]
MGEAFLTGKSGGGAVWNILYGKAPASTPVVDGALLLSGISAKPDVLFDYVPPVSPVENMIYVGYYPATIYRKCYPLQKTKNVSYAISGVKQYSGGKWKVIDAYVGESGQWKQVSWATHYIYVSTRGTVEKWSQDGTRIWRTQINSNDLYKEGNVICPCKPKGVVYAVYSYADASNGVDGCIAVLDMYTGAILQRYEPKRSINFIVIDTACTTLRTDSASYTLNTDGTINSFTETSYTLAEFDKVSNEWVLGNGTTLYKGSKALAFAGYARLHLYPGKYIHSGASGNPQAAVYSDIELTATGGTGNIGCVISRLWDYNRAGDVVGIGYSTYGGKVTFSTCNSSGLVSATPYKALATPTAPHHLAVTPDDTVFAISYDGTNQMPKLYRIDLDNTITEIPGVLSGISINYQQCGIASDPGPRSAFYDLWGGN